MLEVKQKGGWMSEPVWAAVSSITDGAAINKTVSQGLEVGVEVRCSTVGLCESSSITASSLPVGLSQEGEQRGSNGSCGSPWA